MTPFPFALLPFACALLFCGLQASAFDVAYWVWHRSAPLSPSETRDLSAQGVRRLYWHAGTLRPEGEGWRMEAGFSLPQEQPESIAVVPVLRLTADAAAPLGERAAEAVSAALAGVLRRTRAEEAQVDFDCPDRRLSDYAGLLSRCRARIAPARLSATAHAGWSRTPDFARLQRSVDLLVPMFYDLEPDSPARVREGRALPLVDAASLANQIASWGACRVPWIAGLPNFARVTIFRPDGRSRGHLRAWEWDDIAFNPALTLRARSAPGTVVLRAETDIVLADSPISADELLACRLPDLAQFQQAAALAGKAGAVGAAVFRLPGEGPQGGWSLPQLGTLLRNGEAGLPRCRVRRVAQGLELINFSASDLPPRLAGDAGPKDRGWQLEVESTGGAVFREAGPGEFAAVFGHVDPDSPQPKPVPVPIAQRLTWWFADLRAEKSRRTGLLQLAPDANAGSLRWRIPDSPLNSQWETIE